MKLCTQKETLDEDMYKKESLNEDMYTKRKFR